MGRGPSAQSASDSASVLVEERIGAEYANVKIVADNIDDINAIAADLEGITDAAATVGAAVVDAQVAAATAVTSANNADADRIAAQAAKTAAEIAQASAAASAVAADGSADAAAASAATAVTAANAAGLAGGTTGQALIKNSNADYDYSWVELAGGSGLSNGDKGDVVVGLLGESLTVQSAADDFEVKGDLINMTGTPAGIAVIRHTGAGGGSLVLENTGGTYGTSRLTMMNEAGVNGAMFETTDPAVTLTDFVFKAANGQNNIRYEHRAGNYLNNANSWEFQFGINTFAEPNTFAIGNSFVTSAVPLSVPNEAFSGSWDGVFTVPTKNALWDARGAANGFAPLDGDGFVPFANMPSLFFVEVNTVGSQAAQLALVAQEGDVAIRTDINKSFIHNGGVAGTMADWSELLTPTDQVLSIAGLTGAITAAALVAALGLTKGDVGLGNVDNTSDANKPVSTAQAAADALKLSLTGGTVSGNITRTASGVHVYHGNSAHASGKITVSSAAPSGGASGDIWMVVA
jgi:hypothetical protein